MSRYSDVRDEPLAKFLSPIKGYEATLPIPLEESISFVSDFFDGIRDYVFVAKHNCKYPADGLKQDESASIYLYTMQFDIEPSLYKILNSALRNKNRQQLKPWFPFLKLFLSALYKIPSCAKTVWRGICNVDMSSMYPTGHKFVWWGVSSCTSNLEVLNSDQFLGNHGMRTLFSIECRNGKPIGSHSYFENKEHEVILMPGSYFEVMSQLNLEDGLHIIHLKEMEPPITFVKPPFAHLTPTPKPMEKPSILTPIMSKPNKQPLSMKNADHVVSVKTKPQTTQHYSSTKTDNSPKPKSIKSIHIKPPTGKRY
ncbi:unnamed protein product [Rotaria sp. Silwood2]|nr:unnamed protein product [Rotaria sp. Silwood2]CAF2696690.1 unnamed protein product [Rotaria sp. Silwood2]CAF3138703.1 unnamed protein product [Rotaria sp. Silwood2]CAF4095976.1 unnamed protein product [Rotaria sp. Silwood2]CAF4254670.1 unnamed protein product [Rotaria sp. Silwood2]